MLSLSRHGIPPMSATSGLRPLLLAAAGAAALWMAGCQPTVSVHGHQIDPDLLAQIKPGVTSREEVTRLLGSPSTVGTFDYLSGRVPRAPSWIRRAGLEWLYRLVRQPWRWRRQMALPLFVALVARERVRRALGGAEDGRQAGRRTR